MIRFCDECVNFPTGDEWNTDLLDPQRCKKKITMKFRMPKSPIDDQWGFHKVNCKKFEKQEEKNGLV